MHKTERKGRSPFFSLLVLFKNKSPPYVKKTLAELYSKNSFKKTKIMQSLNVVVGSQITSHWKSRGCLTNCKNTFCQTLSYVLKCREQGEITGEKLEGTAQPPVVADTETLRGQKGYD